MDVNADRLKSRLASLPLPERNRVEMALRARVTAIQDRRFERLLATLTPIERKNRMAEIADELRRRIETKTSLIPRCSPRYTLWRPASTVSWRKSDTKRIVGRLTRNLFGPGTSVA